jgi:hypothetical protein
MSRTIVIIALALSCASGVAAAFPIAAPGSEGLKVIVSGTDSVVATYQGNSAAYSNDLFLLLDAEGKPGDDGNPDNDLLLFNNHESPVGSHVTLGAFPVGTELIFRLHVRNTGYDYLTGPGSRNPDGQPHARVQGGWSDNESLVSFEDLFDGPFEYNDLSFSFTNTQSSGPTCERNHAPAFTQTTPACGARIEVAAGQLVHFVVSASDSDATDVDSLSATVLPAGAVIDPPLPVTGNPVTAAFDWTPTAQDEGDHVVGFAAKDSCATTICSFTIHVTTNRPPDCSAAHTSVVELWPPNHRLVPVSVLGITDPDGDPVTLTYAITQDEPVGKGDICPDAAITDGQLWLRAERAGDGDGRVYDIHYTASDGRGGSCSGVLAVCVPHDQRPHHACGDGEQAYVSTGACQPDSGDADARTGLSLTVLGRTAGQVTIAYGLRDPATVQLGVYDVSGRRVALLENAPMAAGEHLATWVTGGLRSGVYYCRLRTATATLTRPVLVLR